MRREIIVLGVALFISGCAGCNNTPPNPGPQPTATGGSGYGGQATTGGQAGAPQGGQGGVGPAECIDPADACDRAGCKLATMNCPERATPKGTPATVVCHQKAAEGRPWPTACIIQSASCEAARACR